MGKVQPVKKTLMSDKIQNQGNPSFISEQALYRTAAFMFGAAFIIYAWYVRINDILPWFAWHGWSPIQFANTILYPDLFTRDFPNAAILKFSLPMWIYPLLEKYFGISPEVTLYLYILADYCFMAAAIAFLSRTIYPRAKPLAIMYCVMLAVASFARTAELSNNGYPMYFGWYYHTAESLGFLAIAMALRKSWGRAWVLAALGFATHAAYAAGICAFIFGLIVVDRRKTFTLGHIVGFIVAGSVIIYWVYGFIEIRKGWGPQVESTVWYTLTKMCQYDFYPFTKRLFTDYHHKHFLPMLGLAALSFHYMRKYWKGDAENQRKILTGQIMVLIVIGIGLAVSEQTFSPFLTRLNLYRAGVLFITIALIYIANGLYEEIVDAVWWKKAIAVGLMVSPFLAVLPAFPLGFLLVLASPSAKEIWKSKHLDTIDFLFILFFVLGILAALFYILAGYVTLRKLHAYVGHPEVIAVIFALGGIFLICQKTKIKFLQTNWVLSLALSFLLLFYGVRFVNDPGQKLTPAQWALFDNYRNAQVWARGHTPGDSLFMTDPSMQYGWRDFSCRSSFGNVREWLMAGWLYKMDLTTYAEGMERFRVFGLDLTEYTGKDAWYANCDRCQDDVRKRFYQMKDEELINVATRFKIDYFVMTKKEMIKPTTLKIAYENRDFLIVKSGI